MSKNKALSNQSAIVAIGKKLRRPLNNIIVRYSLVENNAVLEPSQFSWTKDLEANWRVIREEADAVLAHRTAIPPLGELSPDHKRLTYNDDWRSFFLWAYGYKVEENCQRCPETVRLVSSIPGLRTAMFSIHAPGLHIPRHKGSTKGMLTCHLGLKVPVRKRKCRIKVRKRYFSWEEGKTFIFDDTSPHEVWNDTAEERVILLLQFNRPVRFPGNLIAYAFLQGIRHSPFIKDGRRNLSKWEKKYRAEEISDQKDPN